MPKEAKNPDNIHRSLFNKAVFHFYLIECSTCHVPERKSSSLYLVDDSTGQPAWYSTDKAGLVTRAEIFDAACLGALEPWLNRYERVRGDGERYVAAVPKVSNGSARCSPRES